MNNLLFIALFALFINSVVAQTVYKTVDANGNVEYTQTRPAAPQAPVKLHNVAPAQGAEVAACASWQCYADQLERDRIARERAYAKRDAVQARIEADAKREAAAQAAQDHRATCQRFPRASECLGKDAALKRTRGTARR